MALFQASLPDGQPAELYARPGIQPGESEPLRHAARFAYVAKSVVHATDDGLEEACAEEGDARPVRLVLGPKVLHRVKCSQERTLEVAGDRQSPGDGQLGDRVQVGIVDAVQQGRQSPSRRERSL